MIFGKALIGIHSSLRSMKVKRNLNAGSASRGSFFVILSTDHSRGNATSLEAHVSDQGWW